MNSERQRPVSESRDDVPPADRSVSPQPNDSRDVRSPTPLEDCWWESCQARLSVIASPWCDGVQMRFCMVHRGWNITNTRVDYAGPADTHSSWMQRAAGCLSAIASDRKFARDFPATVKVIEDLLAQRPASSASHGAACWCADCQSSAEREHNRRLS